MGQEPRCAWDAADFDAVGTLALERYGSEIICVLAAQLHSTSDAGEVYSLFTEDL